jgi:hypothetical protein
MRLNLYHHHIWPTEVPPWVVGLSKKLDLVLKNQEIIMSQNDDLNSAVSSLAKGYGDLHDAVVQQTDKLTEAMHNVPQPDPATSKAIQDAIANITNITGKMATDAAALTSNMPGTTTIAPPQVTQPASPATADVPKLDQPTVTDPNATPPGQTSSASPSEDTTTPAVSSTPSAPQV